MAREIVDNPMGTPILTVPVLARRLGKSPQGVDVAVNKLVELEIPSEPRGSYNRVFVATDMYHAMTAPMGAVRHAP